MTRSPFRRRVRHQARAGLVGPDATQHRLRAVFGRLKSVHTMCWRRDRHDHPLCSGSTEALVVLGTPGLGGRLSVGQTRPTLSRPPTFVPGTKAILDRLAENADPAASLSFQEPRHEFQARSGSRTTAASPRNRLVVD